MLTGANKELTNIKAMMKQLAALVTAQAAIVAFLSANITDESSGGGSGGGQNTDKNKVRPVLHVCAHCKK